MKKVVPLFIRFGLINIGTVESQVVSWTRVIQASENTRVKTADGKDYLVYTLYDTRFNTTDWFDTWIEDRVEKRRLE